MVATSCRKVKVPSGLLVSWAGGVAGLPVVMDLIVNVEVLQFSIYTSGVGPGPEAGHVDGEGEGGLWLYQGGVHAAQLPVCQVLY